MAGTATDLFLASSATLGAQIADQRTALIALADSQKAAAAVLSSGNLPSNSDDLADAVIRYKAEVSLLPGLTNAQAASYSLLDPTIRTDLASSADV